MKIVVATDSFKDSLSASQACRIIADAIRHVIPCAFVIEKPLADGGEGTAQVIMEACHGRWIKSTVMGPLPEMQVEAGFAWMEGDKTAVVEMVKASGLELLESKQRNPMKTTTYGTGQLIDAAIRQGAETVLLTVGGSATVDLGCGCAAALGWRFMDKDGREILPCGGNLHRIKRIESPSEKTNLTIQVLCDVTNPLLGQKGAARVYGPQKGAVPEMVEQLEEGLTHMTDLIRSQLGVELANMPGAGAAGGLSAGAVAFLSARLVSGIEMVMEQIRLTEDLADADWVITGEGCFDSQSLDGKVVSGVTKRASRSNIKVAVLAGQIVLPFEVYSQHGIDVAMSCRKDGMSLEKAISNAPQLLGEITEQFARNYLMR
ncbi:MAG: glycerate kinase [Sedimentisphaerales bacterium]|nr:glycerate kinase [Sedimentisphaerales bacterium]